jgi:peptidoglycan/LPS O-acetylase OafA/YrhL
MSTKSEKHIAALDGLRAAAILLVLIRHLVPHRPGLSAAAKTFNGLVGLGWSGVDLFFVLSGFLITGILLDARRADGYFRNFYARRVLRIFPLYYLMVFLCTVVFTHVPAMRDAVPGPNPLWWWLYLSNVVLSFAPEASSGWLGNFWSLAVEEHFYLLWPAIIYFSTRRTTVWVCISCLVVASLCRIGFNLAGNPYAGYALTPCRMDALAAGALVAIAYRGTITPGMKAWTGRVCIGSGIALFVVAFWRHSFSKDPLMQLAGFPLTYCFYATLLFILVTAEEGNWLRRLLELRVLRTIGKYSYGMYVFQVVAGLLERMGLWVAPFPDSAVRVNDFLNACVQCVIIFAVAFVSWHLYEKHFLKLKRYFQYRHRDDADVAAPKTALA